MVDANDDIHMATYGHIGQADESPPTGLSHMDPELDSGNAAHPSSSRANLEILKDSPLAVADVRANVHDSSRASPAQARRGRAGAPERARREDTGQRSESLAIGQWMRVEELAPWVKNPRKNDAAVPRVAASIERFGFVAPVVIWTSRNRIVAGHTRIKALQMLLAEDASFVPSGAPGCGLAPVRFHEFADEAEADLYTLADNKLAELSEWDDEKLADIASNFSEDDLSVSGFDDKDIAKLRVEVESHDRAAPSEFPSFDDGIETDFCCPSCKYEWSGKPK